MITSGARKKAAIFHAEREPISETLCDHAVMEARENQGLKDTQ
jgi:hypothetical protein